MNSKARKITQILDELYPHPEIPLHHTTPYTLLIAVLLSAQCTDKRVNSITPELFALANNPQDMARLGIATIQKIIHTCGLAPTKARAIHALSKILIEKHNGIVPDNFKDLEALPGVGHKTASVVMAQAFGHDAFPVDTHIHRCAKRWELTSGKSIAQTEKDLKAIFPKKSWSKIHLQIIYYARQYCTARNHNTTTCPICQVSRAPRP
ncbi:MAG: endonuclease III [Waddliaceae bacterium]|jgi:endonuclease III|nr:endonuclease III [Waddliaceae bacterium]MBT3579154.1 endonuclease III [Waddliaceae bacterium]MBT4444310.1 endonuclease III [Waddliaceae bacterium]MBT6928525.1 endonuclease III [Waddliaceae bacterium]MBT7264863.1 endonuclease III [Waddliaceae bacterium]